MDQCTISVYEIKTSHLAQIVPFPVDLDYITIETLDIIIQMFAS